MAKRFTDTEKWDQAWFRKLPARLKCAWDYLCNKCDHAGIWHVDMEAMEFGVGEAVTLDELTQTFKVETFGEDKLFIPGFIEFQYNCSIDELNPSNKVHNSVLTKLKKLAPYKPLGSCLDTPKDKDKEKDKDMDKEKEKEKDKDWRALKTQPKPHRRSFEGLMSSVAEFKETGEVPF